MMGINYSEGDEVLITGPSGEDGSWLEGMNELLGKTVILTKVRSNLSVLSIGVGVPGVEGCDWWFKREWIKPVKQTPHPAKMSFWRCEQMPHRSMGSYDAVIGVERPA